MISKPQLLFAGAAILYASVVFVYSFRSGNDINYLNQPDPGMQAKLFAPGSVSTNLSEHSAPAFSPDGDLVLWTSMDRSYRGSIHEMRFENGSWTKPYRPSFADSASDDFYPSFSPDGQQLYFSSRRKMPAGSPAVSDIALWVVDRKNGKWSLPAPVNNTLSNGREYAHSISRNGNLYWSVPADTGKDMNIWTTNISRKNAGQPTLLPQPVNSTHYEDGPYISPDESFLIFESDRPGGIGESIDLYICFRKADGSFGAPVNMGPKINTEHAERFAGLSPDGRFLFFGSGRNMNDENWGFDIFWISSGIIKELRKKSGEE